MNLDLYSKSINLPNLYQNNKYEKKMFDIPCQNYRKNIFSVQSNQQEVHYIYEWKNSSSSSSIKQFIKLNKFEI